MWIKFFRKYMYVSRTYFFFIWCPYVVQLCLQFTMCLQFIPKMRSSNRLMGSTQPRQHTALYFSWNSVATLIYQISTSIQRCFPDVRSTSETDVDLTLIWGLVLAWSNFLQNWQRYFNVIWFFAFIPRHSSIFCSLVGRILCCSFIQFCSPLTGNTIQQVKSIDYFL